LPFPGPHRPKESLAAAACFWNTGPRPDANAALPPNAFWLYTEALPPDGRSDMERLPIDEKEADRLRHGLRKIDLFSSLEATDFEALLDCVELRSYDAGAYLFKQGQTADALYLLLEGEVDVKVRPNMISRSETIETLWPGQTVGEGAFLDAAPRSASAQAATPVKLFVVEKEDVDRLLADNAAFKERLTSLARIRKEMNRRAA
jgi:signal-transduction protein with cAMP-binding, CBS, and nucleotidyltransferase domain